MPEQKMKITEEAFADFTGHMCRAGFTNSISNEPLTLEQLKELEMRMTQTLFDRKFSIHEHQRAMKKDILEMSDPELIKNYQVGWEHDPARR